jgi:hypothetical protein
MAKQQKTTAREWAGRVRRWERSGLTASEFGQREGFSGKQLTWWKWHLSRNGQAATAGATKRRAGATRRGGTKAAKAEGARAKRAAQRAHAVPAQFIPVKLPATVSVPTVEIVLGNGRVVRVPSGCDGAWLAQVLTAADEERAC